VSEYIMSDAWDLLVGGSSSNPKPTQKSKKSKKTNSKPPKAPIIVQNESRRSRDDLYTAYYDASSSRRSGRKNRSLTKRHNDINIIRRNTSGYDGAPITFDIQLSYDSDSDEIMESVRPDNVMQLFKESRKEIPRKYREVINDFLSNEIQKDTRRSCDYDESNRAREARKRNVVDDAVYRILDVKVTSRVPPYFTVSYEDVYKNVGTKNNIDHNQLRQYFNDTGRSMVDEFDNIKAIIEKYEEETYQYEIEDNRSLNIDYGDFEY